MSDSVLAESAQLRSALQAKTYLQALSPDERRRLLKGAKVPGHRRKHHTSAVAAATARRDELQQLLDQEKHRCIDNQTVLAQQPDVSYSSKPAAHETAAWETARLRVRATSMAAENDALKNYVAQLMHQISNMDRSVQVVSNGARARSQRMTEAAAARIAELEDQVERQQRALSEMSVASEGLARDNCAVSDEVVQLREDKASQSQNMEALQDRVAKLQELYMLDLDQSKALTVHDSIQQSNLLQLATPEMLAVSQPPASFPVPQTAKASTIVPALHEIETLRRERGSLKEQVKSKSDKLARAEEANAELSTLLAAERKAAKLAGAAAQKQLLGSMRRIQYMVSKAKESEAAQQQKDAYVRKLEARLLNQHKAPGRKQKPEDENSRAATGSIKQRSKGTVAAASKQTTEAAVPEGSSSHSAPATPMFTYHTLSHPLQDASNLPSGHVIAGPFAHQQAPTESAPEQGQWQQGQPSESCPSHGQWQQGQPPGSYPDQVQGHWQHGHPSRSSSDCFSMDPAQLEADIAALTSAIAEDAAGLDGGSQGVPSCQGYPAARPLAHAASTRPITELDSRPESKRSGLSGCGRAFKGSEPQQFSHLPPQPFPQLPLQYSPMPMHQQVYRRTQHGVEVPVAASEIGLPSTADRHGLYQQDDREEASGLQHRHQEEDEGAADVERPWWHRRQSKEERLADAAEARLLGLAGRPSSGHGSEHEPPDWHLRRQQPTSYSRKAVQVDKSTSSGAPNPPLPRFTGQEAAAGSAHLREAPTGGPPAPQISSGSNARGREMLRAALHNLATHDGSPPSSSAASSHHDAPTLSAPVTSITANECFDGSALFDSAASASCITPAEGFLHSTNGGHQAPHNTEADIRHHKRPTTAKGVGSGAHVDQPAAHQLLDLDPSLQHESKEQQQQHLPGCAPPLQMSHQASTQMSAQHLSHLPNQMPTQLGCQMDQQQRTSGLPGQSAACNFSSAHRAKPGPFPQVGSDLLHTSESSEELMSLEELEHCIASLNTTLLRAPSELQAAPVPSDRAGVKTKQSTLYANDRPAAYRQQSQRQAGVDSGRGDRPHKLGRETGHSSDTTDGLAQEQPGMTAWQKLTAKHQAPQASRGRVDAMNDEGDSYSSASSPPDSTGRLMQAAPLQSPPSTGLRHYSAASKHMSDGWDSNSDTRVLEWAESCSQGASQDQHAWQTGASGTSSTSPQPSSSRPFTMLRSPAAALSSRHLSQGSAKSKQALQAKLSPVAASWRQYGRSSTAAFSKVPAQASNLSS